MPKTLKMHLFAKYPAPSVQIVPFLAQDLCCFTLTVGVWGRRGGRGEGGDFFVVGVGLSKGSQLSQRDNHRRVHAQLDATIAPLACWPTTQGMAMSTCPLSARHGNVHKQTMEVNSAVAGDTTAHHASIHI